MCSASDNNLSLSHKQGNILNLPRAPQPIVRLDSKGLTGETWYDFDKPLGKHDQISIQHFNDVYNIEQDSHHEGGISRFSNAMRSEAGENPLILFSGDCFNPSVLSTHTKGRHLPPFLNMLKVHSACLGNHDFDFGIDQLEILSGSTQFPWLLSNVFDAETNDPLGGARYYRIFEWQQHIVGIMGLVEEDWISTIFHIEKDDIIFKDFVHEANKISEIFRNKDVDIIIALTHMRSPNDLRLAMECEDIDIILGGHDHDYFPPVLIDNKTLLLKSGSDFKTFTNMSIVPIKPEDAHAAESLLNDDEKIPSKMVNGKKVQGNFDFLQDNKAQNGEFCMFSLAGGSKVTWKCIYVTSATYDSNYHIDQMVQRYMDSILSQMNKPLVRALVDIDARFSVLRTQETGIGNWLCDCARRECHADIAMLNAGTMRADCVFPAGLITIGDLSKLLPMMDYMVMVAIPGELIVQMLENSVSKYPKKEGRFLQISGIKFEFDSRKSAGERVIKSSVAVKLGETNDYEKIDLVKLYKVSTKEYIHSGKDGYTMITDCEVLRCSEDMTPLPTLVRKTLSRGAIINGFRRCHTKMMSKHIDNFKNVMCNEGWASLDGTPTVAEGLVMKNTPRAHEIKKFDSIQPMIERFESKSPHGAEIMGLLLVVEGRIINIALNEKE